MLSDELDDPRKSPLPPAAPAAIEPLAALAALALGVGVLSPEWRVLYANDALERAFGVRPSELLGRSVWDALPGVRGTAAERALRATMADGHPRSARLERRASLADVILDVSAARCGAGLCLEVRDVSTALRRERELADRAEESEALRALARRMAAEFDSDTLLHTLCEAAQVQCRAEGASVLMVRGREGEIVAAAGRVAAPRGTRHALEGSLAGHVLAVRSAVAEPHYAEAFPSLALTARGFRVGPILMTPLAAGERILGTLSVMRAEGAPVFSAREEQRLTVIADYAALVLWKAHLLEAARAANEAKGNFLATMSHELRTPIAALTGYGELFADGILGPLSEHQRDAVERMRTVTHHLAVMIEEILTFANLEAGREMVCRTEASAADLVRAAAAVVEPLARQKGLDLGYSLPGQTPPLLTDIDKVRQILVNLAGNAVKFTERGSVRLEVETCEETDEVWFRVRDTGIGIAEGDLRLLFLPFSQLDTGLTRRYGGTGLGLYISRRLSSLVGGRIEVESTPGRGSTFTLALPTRLAAPARRQPSRAGDT